MTTRAQGTWSEGPRTPSWSLRYVAVTGSTQRYITRQFVGTVARYSDPGCSYPKQHLHHCATHQAPNTLKYTNEMELTMPSGNKSPTSICFMPKFNREPLESSDSPTRQNLWTFKTSTWQILSQLSFKDLFIYLFTRQNYRERGDRQIEVFSSAVLLPK